MAADQEVPRVPSLYRKVAIRQASTIGDTHEYAEPFGFDLDEDAYDHLRARAETLLGAPVPPR